MMFVGYGASDTGTRNWRKMGLIISCKYNDSNMYMNTSTLRHKHTNTQTHTQTYTHSHTHTSIIVSIRTPSIVRSNKSLNLVWSK